MIPRSHSVIISGATGLAFLSCLYGTNVGIKCWNEEVLYPHIRAIVTYANRLNVNLYYPLDVVCGDSPVNGEDYEGETLEIDLNQDEIPNGYTSFDIGSKTIQRDGSLLPDMKTVVWCGCLGKVEAEMFQNGTKALSDNIASNADLKVYVFGNKCVNYSLQSSDYDSYKYLCPYKIGEILLSLSVAPGICLLSNKEEEDPLPKEKTGEEEENQEDE